MPWPVMQPVLEVMVEPGGEMAAAHRFDARPVVARALGLLVEGARREVRLNVYHRRCTRDMQADDGGAFSAWLAAPEGLPCVAAGAME